MKLRKILSLSLAAATALSIGTVAFAAAPLGAESDRTAAGTVVGGINPTAPTMDVPMTGAVYNPVIRVQVFSEDRIYLNPTGGAIQATLSTGARGDALPILPADPDNASTPRSLTYKIEGKQLASSPIIIRSDTNSDVVVNATVTVSRSPSVTWQEGTTITDNSGKAACLAITKTTSKSAAELREIMYTDDNIYAVTPLGDTDFLNYNTGTVPIKADAVAEGNARPTQAQTINGVATLSAAEWTGEGAEATVAPQYAAITLVGDLSDNPEGGWNPQTDTIRTVIVLTFTGATPT